MRRGGELEREMWSWEEEPCCWLFLFVSCGEQPPKKFFCVGGGSFAVVINFKFHEGRSGSVFVHSCTYRA